MSSFVILDVKDELSPGLFSRALELRDLSNFVYAFIGAGHGILSRYWVSRYKA